MYTLKLNNNCHKCKNFSPLSPDSSSWTKTGTLTNGTCTMRRPCTSSAWDPRSWPPRGRCSLDCCGRTKMSGGGLSASRWRWRGRGRSSTTASTRRRTSMPQITRKTPACTMLLLRAWKPAFRWDSDMPSTWLRWKWSGLLDLRNKRGQSDWRSAKCFNIKFCVFTWWLIWGLFWHPL